MGLKWTTCPRGNEDSDRCPLVILADISGSMERYSRMVLHLVHALSVGDVASQVETFVFGTLPHTHHNRFETQKCGWGTRPGKRPGARTWEAERGSATR